MATVTHVLYYNNQGTATARPVFSTFEADAAFVPDLVEMGYAADVSWGILPAVPAELVDDDAATVNSLTVNPATLATATSAAANFLAERQGAMLSLLTALSQAYDWTQATDSKLTDAARADFKLWREKLGGIPRLGDPWYQAVWATSPEDIVIPATPAEAYTTSDVAGRMGRFMDEVSFPITKIEASGTNNGDVITFVAADGRFRSRHVVIDTIGPFHLDTLAAGANAAMGILFNTGAGTFNVVVRDPLAGRPGKVIGIRLAGTQTLTGGSLTARVRLNGSIATFNNGNCQIVNGAAYETDIVKPADGVNFLASDQLGISLLAGAAYAPTGNRITAWLIVQYDPT